MQVCRKCGKQSDGTSRICRACGGILDQLPDAQALTGNPPIDPETGPRSSHPDQDLAVEKGAAVANPITSPEWTCSKCGETVPGNFAVCWSCQTERAADAEPSVSKTAENNDQQLAAEEPGQSLLEDSGQDPPRACSRCGSTKLIPGWSICDQGEGSDGDLKVVVYGQPDALIFRDRLDGQIKTDICGDCGHLDLRVANPRQLYKHYQKWQSVRQSSSSACPHCGMLVVDGSPACPNCGTRSAAER